MKHDEKPPKRAFVRLKLNPISERRIWNLGGLRARLVRTVEKIHFVRTTVMSFRANLARTVVIQAGSEVGEDAEGRLGH